MKTDWPQCVVFSDGVIVAQPAECRQVFVTSLWPHWWVMSESEGFLVIVSLCPLGIAESQNTLKLIYSVYNSWVGNLRWSQLGAL